MKKHKLNPVETIEEMGGMIPAIERGWPQREIARAAFEFQRAVEKKEYLTVGVNAFEQSATQGLDTLRISPEVERNQRAALASMRRDRDPVRVEAALARLTEAAKTDENLIPLIVDAVRAEATEGEIIGAMRSVFGEYREAPRF
jgi:methylmalonyl-CoA mutase N-terminal domain/subunit